MVRPVLNYREQYAVRTAAPCLRSIPYGACSGKTELIFRCQALTRSNTDTVMI